MRVVTKLALLVALMAVMVPAAQGALIGYWDFEEGSGSTAFDQSVNHYNGTITDATHVAGRVGSYALHFDGTLDKVVVPYNAALSLAGTDYTYAFWAQRDGNTGAALIALGTFVGSEVQGYGAYFFPGTPYRLYMVQGGAGAVFGADSRFDVAVPPSWVHLAVVYNSADQKRYLYVDGALTNSYATYAGVTNSGNGLWLGGDPGWGDVCLFKGSLDDVRIYNNALTSAEVALLAGVPEPSTAVLLAGAGLVGLLACGWRKRK